MAITFVPTAGTVVLCDFDLGGFQVPEMTKRRPVVVVQRRFRDYFPTTVVVVPLSASRPPALRTWHYVIPSGRYYFFSRGRDVYAKCDMIAHVALHRLDRIKLRGQWIAPRLSKRDLAGVREAVAYAVGISNPQLTRVG